MDPLRSRDSTPSAEHSSQPTRRSSAKSVRRLKVSYHCPDSRSRFVLRPPEPMPLLRLQGRWLEEAGFEIGAYVHVHISRGRLVLDLVVLEHELDSPPEE